jgi:hypothetical protein
MSIADCLELTREIVALAEDDYQFRVILLRDALKSQSLLSSSTSTSSDDLVLLAMAWKSMGALMSQKSGSRAFALRQQMQLIV